MININAINEKYKPNEHIKETATESHSEQIYKEPQDIQKDIKLYRLQENNDDAKHSKDNTAEINKRYSQIIRIIFNPYIFYMLIILLLACYIIADERFLKIVDCKILIYLSEKILYFIFYFFIILLSFPTAKGIRKLFREILLNLTKTKQ